MENHILEQWEKNKYKLRDYLNDLEIIEQIGSEHERLISVVIKYILNDGKDVPWDTRSNRILKVRPKEKTSGIRYYIIPSSRDKYGVRCSGYLKTWLSFPTNDFDENELLCLSLEAIAEAYWSSNLSEKRILYSVYLDEYMSICDDIIKHMVRSYAEFA
jgi:hypothetical protein